MARSKERTRSRPVVGLRAVEAPGSIEFSRKHRMSAASMPPYFVMHA